MCVFFFFKQKTAYEMRISDWSSDVCSSDLSPHRYAPATTGFGDALHTWQAGELTGAVYVIDSEGRDLEAMVGVVLGTLAQECQGGFASKPRPVERVRRAQVKQFTAACRAPQYDGDYFYAFTAVSTGEKVMMIYKSNKEHTSELQ